jgi:hypothetical protein
VIASGDCVTSWSPKAPTPPSVYPSCSAALTPGPSDQRPRRDFLLDSGGVSALAVDRDLLAAYLELLRLRFDGALLVPVPVLTEVRSGHRRSDVLVDRLIKAIGAEGDIYAPLTVAAAIRAGVLRAEHRAGRVETSRPRTRRSWRSPRS